MNETIKETISDLSESSVAKTALSFRGKRAVVSLFTILAIGAYYASRVIPMLTSTDAVPAGALNLVVSTIVLIIVVDSVLQIVLYLGAGRVGKRTSHDNAISLRASRNAHVVLTVGVLASFASMFFKLTPFQMGSVLVLGFLVAEVAKFATQIAAYRSWRP